MRFFSSLVAIGIAATLPVIGAIAPVVVPPVLEDAWQRAVAAAATSESAREKALHELRRLVGGIDADADTLVKRALPAIGTSDARRDAALEILIGLGPRAAAAKPALFAAAASESRLTGRRSAIDALLAIGIAPEDRVAVSELLQKEVAPETRRYLQAALGEDAVPLSDESRIALTKLRARAVDPTVLWNHPDARVREEAIDALAAVDADDALKARWWLKALRDRARTVRMAGVRQLAGLPVERWLPKASVLLGSASPTTRAAVCALVELAASRLTASRRALRDRLVTAMRSYPRESWDHSAQTAWRALGVAPEDLPVLRRLIRSRKLAPLRRAQAIRLAESLGAAARELVPELDALAAEAKGVGHWPAAVLWQRTGVDGDLTAAAEALRELDLPEGRVPPST